VAAGSKIRQLNDVSACNLRQNFPEMVPCVIAEQINGDEKTSGHVGAHAPDRATPRRILLAAGPTAAAKARSPGPGGNLRGYWTNSNKSYYSWIITGMISDWPISQGGRAAASGLAVALASLARRAGRSWRRDG
jgi:hypothetical protein